MDRVATLLFCCWIVSIFWVAAAARRQSMTPSSAPVDPMGPEPRAKDRKPNIVLILTDDQDVELGSLNFMPRTLRLMREGGAEFRHAYVTTPMCCPSRSSLLTGMYVHNHEVYTNNDNCSSPRWQASHESRSFATYLSNAGYRTGYFGKYLNKYNGSYIPAGWREWGGLIMNSRYYNYSINLNGKRIKHGADYHKDYYPDLIANDSVTFLRQSKQYFSRKPVMLVLSFPAPHGPEDSAPQFSHLFFNVTTHHTPAYDFAPNPDKQWILQVTDRMRPIHRQFTDLLMTKRLQTLQSVDEAVERIHAELKALGELDNTYLIYTSDHGYHLGQFGLVKGKSFPFEFDVRVPFLVRGPGVQPGTLIDDIVLNLDLAPTFLDIAGVEIPSHMDGRSFLPLLHRGPNHNRRKRTRWPDTFLIESSGRRETPESIAAEAKRLARLKEMSPSSSPPTPSEITSTETHYENEEDDDQDDDDEEEERQQVLEIESGSLIPTNNNNTPDAVLQQQQVTLSLDSIPVLSQPDLQSDNRVVPSVNSGTSSLTTRMARIAAECRRPGSRGPCKPGQRWECRRDGARWRRHKCKHVSPNNSVNYYYGIRDREGRCQCNKMRNIDTSTPALLHHRANHRFLRFPATEGKSLNRNDQFQRMLLLREHQQAAQRSRIRREASLESRMQSLLTDLEAELHGLQSIGGVQGCKLFPSGNVNCTNAVYSDPKAWRSSRDFVEGRIRILRTKLEELKEIRRHLRSRRPTNLHSYDASTESHDGENLGYHPRHNIHHQRHRGRFNDSWFEDYDENTTGFHRQNRLNTTDSYDEFSNSNDPSLAGQQCVCENEEKDEKEQAKEARRKLKEERLRKKERKMRKKAKMEKECLSEKMNCFNHDNDHWKTAPLWTEGPFCFCMNANNNTYSCLRTINVTHNFLYCEFVTGTITFYNLRIDPYEQWNRVNMLTKDELAFLSAQLAQLKACKGSRECTVGSASIASTHNPLNNPTSTTGADNLALETSNIHNNHNKKRKYWADTQAHHFTTDPLDFTNNREILLQSANTNRKRKNISKVWPRRQAWKASWTREQRRRFRQQQRAAAAAHQGSTPNSQALWAS